MSLLPVIAFCIIVSALLTIGLIRSGPGLGLIASPNGRSSHLLPTPTGGGLAIVVTFYGYLAWLGFSAHSVDGLWWLASGIPVALIGYADDHRHVNASLRLLIHIAAAGFVAVTVGLPALELFGLVWRPDALWVPLYVIALVWLLNLFNFMDGIDGIAAVEALCVLLGAAGILSFSGSIWLLPMLALASCVAGFLCFNWPPARIFMGDIGSGFLGFILGAFAFLSVGEGGISLWSWLILLAVFIADATVTLFQRALRKQKVYMAHRSHAYQILARRWQSHRKVTLAVLLTNLTWLLPLAFAATLWPYWGLTLAAVAYLPLIVIALRVGAGTTND